MAPRPTGKARNRLNILTSVGIALVGLLTVLGLFGGGVAQAASTLTYPGASAPCNTTLQACIDGAAAGDTVEIAAGAYITDEIVIAKALTLTGAGPGTTALQALPSQRVISVSAGLTEGVVIANLRITGGSVDGAGGGIHSGAGTPLTLIDVEVLENTATGSGGGVFAEGELTVEGGRFAGNVAEFGGGLRVEGNGQIMGAEFITNTATGDAGGAFADGEQVTVTASSFISNTAARSAGGLWAETSATVSATDFFSNTAGATGGGLHVNGGQGVVTDSRFVGNRVGPDLVDGDEQGGGGMYQSGGAVILTGVTFEGNRSQGLGGGLGARASVTISGSHFLGNTAANSGAGIYQEEFAAGSLAIDASTFVSNVADFGGGIYTYAALAITGTDFLSNTGELYGGGLFSNRSGAIVGGRFAGNRTTVAVPGALVGGAGIYNDSGALVISGTAFVENTSAQQGGGLLMTDSGSASFAIAHSTFTGNRAESGAGLEGAGPITLITSHFTDNVASGEGGGVRSQGALTITGVAFVSNTATYGGGVAAAGVATVTNSVFLSNTAGSEGGALASSGHSQIADSRFDRNQANFGGALWLGVLNGSALDRTRFSRNRAAIDGGAIFVNDSTALTLTNSLLVANTAGSGGGAIASNSPGLQVINATVAGNQAIAGGGIMVQGGGLDLGNSILWANSPSSIGLANLQVNVVGPNLIQGGAFGSLDQDPRFVRDPDLGTDDLGDLHLRQESPAIDSGDNARLPAHLALDLDGLPRLFDVVAIADTGSGAPPIDLGAFEVNNQLPTAAANGPYTGVEGSSLPVTATGSTSGDVGQALTEFAWDCTDDGIFDVATTEPEGSTCLYPDQGAFTLRLRVTDAGAFTAEQTATVTVENVAPVLSGQLDQSAQQGEAKEFALGEFADPGPDAPWQVTVEWGDGETGTFTRTVTGALPALVHSYATAAEFSANVTVQDKDGGEASAGFKVTVAPPEQRIYLPLVRR